MSAEVDQLIDEVFGQGHSAPPRRHNFDDDTTSRPLPLRPQQNVAAAREPRSTASTGSGVHRFDDSSDDESGPAVANGPALTAPSSSAKVSIAYSIPQWPALGAKCQTTRISLVAPNCPFLLCTKCDHRVVVRTSFVWKVPDADASFYLSLRQHYPDLRKLEQFLIPEKGMCAALCCQCCHISLHGDECRSVTRLVTTAPPLWFCQGHQK
jgi:hypothetical protein